MSNTIDNRVVEMEFDNKQFENNAKTTMSTLDKLKQSLNFSSSVNSLSKLQDAGRSFSLRIVTDSIDSVCERFSTMGIVGATVIQNLTNSAIDLAKKMAGIFTTPLVEGGKNRALNIEQAKFQLQGLGVEWDTIKDDINYGVKDTAYGLDAAAKVASQLVASNIEVGDSMKTSLRAVSGVAAMTNSSYEEIGHIFTTVAGNGKLMTEQLRMLSARGLNIAAELGKQLGKTEAEIRDMVSKGKIDFKTFSEAMDKAFGEHAKDANKTFTGAISNMKAALSRIGADVATPAFENLRKAINALTPVIDGVHESLKPLIDLLTKGMEKASDYAVKILDSFGKVEEENLDDLEDIAKRVIAGEFGMGEERRKNLEALGYSYENVQAKVNELLGAAAKVKKSRDFSALTNITKTLVKAFTNLGKGIIQVVKPIREAFHKVFPPVTLARIQSVADMIERMTAKFKISDKTTGKLSRTFTGLFKAFDMAKRFGVLLLKAMSPLLSVFGKIGDMILDVTAWIGDHISAMDEAEKKNGTFAKIMQKVADFIAKAADKIKQVLDGISEKIKKAVGLIKPKLTSLKNVFSMFFNSFARGYKQVTGIDLHIPTIKELIGFVIKLKDKFFQTAQSIGKSDNAIVRFFKSFIPDKETFIEKLSKGFENLGILIGKIRNKIIAFKDKIPNIKNSISKFFDGFKIKDPEKKTKGMGIITKALSFVSGVISKVSPTIGEGFSKITNAFKDAFSGIDYQRMTKILNIGFFVVLIVFIKRLIGVISTLGSFGRPLHNINGILVGIKSTFIAYTNDIKTNTILKIAAAIGILAVSLVALSMIKPVRLLSAVGAMTFLFLSLAGMTLLMQWIAEIQITGKFDLLLVASALVGVAIAMSILTNAVKKLSKLEPKKLLAGLLGVIALIAALGVFLKAANIGGLQTATILQEGTAILIISVALNVMASAVKKLSEIDLLSMIKGLLGIYALLSMIAAFTQVSVTRPLAIATAIGVAIMAASMLIFADAVNKFAETSWGTVFKSILAFAVILLTVSVAANLMIAAIPGALAMVIASSALIILAKAVNEYSNTSWGTVFKSIVSIALTLILLAAGLTAMIAALPGAAALVVASAALIILAKAVNSFADTAWGTIGKSLVAIGGSLILLAIGLTLMIAALPGALALLVAANAFAIITPVLKALGETEWKTLLKGLLGLASVLGVLGISSILLLPALPTMAALAVVMVALGAGMLALGGGMFLLSAGITALGLSTVGISAFIAMVTEAIILLINSFVKVVEALLNAAATLIPKVSDVAWEIVTRLVQGLADHIDPIVQAGTTIMIALLRGISDRMDSILPLVTIIIIKLFNGLSVMIPLINQAGINLMVSLINGMADGIRENEGVVMAAVKNLISSVIEFSITALEETLGMIPGVGSAVIEPLEKAKISIRNTLTGGEMAEIGKDGADEVLQGIDDSKDSGTESGHGLGTSIIEGLSGVLGDFGSIGNGFGIDFSNGVEEENEISWMSGFNLGGSASDGLGESVLDAASLGTSYGTKFSNALSDTDGLVFNSAEELGDTASSGLDIDFSSLGLSAGDTYSWGIFDSFDGAKDSGDGLANSAVDGVNDANILFENAGTENAKSYYSDGIRGEEDKVEQQGKHMAFKGYKGARTQIVKYRESGVDSGKGYARGLDVSTPEVESAAERLARSALYKLNSTLKINSPSKETEQSGAFFDTGFVSGVKKHIGVVKAASEFVGNRAKRSLNDALSKVSNILNGNLDFDPTIRPVVDLSNVTDSVNSMNGLFGDRSVKLGGEISPYRNNLDLTSDISTQLLKNNMNGSTNVVQAIGEIRDDIYYLGEMIGKMQVVIDSRALVGSIAVPMNNALGTTMMRKGRSN